MVNQEIIYKWHCSQLEVALKNSALWKEVGEDLSFWMSSEQLNSASLLPYCNLKDDTLANEEKEENDEDLFMIDPSVRSVNTDTEIE